VGNDYWKPPRGFNASEKRAWYELLALLHERLLGINPGAVEVAAVQLARCREARKELRKTGSIVAVGSKGEPVPSPLLRIEKEAGRAFLQACRELGLDTGARRRLSQPDRALCGTADMIEEIGVSPMTEPPDFVGEDEGLRLA
jgi:phage terminase small subunit